MVGIYVVIRIDGILHWIPSEYTFRIKNTRTIPITLLKDILKLWNVTLEKSGYLTTL